MDARPIAKIPPGTPLIVGDRIVPMPRMQEGDRLLAVHRTGDVLVIGERDHDIAREAAARAQRAFKRLADTPDDAITAFFEAFAARLTEDAVWAEVAAANTEDVERAKAAGRSTTRLVATDTMRAGMIDGLRAWASAPSRRGETIERRETRDWTIQRVRAPLGVVAFVFEGRPNVFADGAGVVRGANTCVMRIGSDALGTALAIDEHAIAPAIEETGLPDGVISLVRSRSHASAHALFTMPDVRLAVARGSGASVALLGSIAEQHGIPASLHGTGGGWLYLHEDAPIETARNAVRNSLDRKVCNTLNVLCVHHSRRDLLAAVLDDLGETSRLHVAEPSKSHLPPELYERKIAVVRPEGEVLERQADVLPMDDLGREWEWEGTPELSLVTVQDMDETVALFDRYAPRMVASIVTASAAAFERFAARVDAPYVGNGFTRWVDGQWAWGRPELGLTNWERGRLLGRSGILAGDDVYTVRDVFTDRTGRAEQRR